MKRITVANGKVDVRDLQDLMTPPNNVTPAIREFAHELIELLKRFEQKFHRHDEDDLVKYFKFLGTAVPLYFDPSEHTLSSDEITQIRVELSKHHKKKSNRSLFMSALMTHFAQNDPEMISDAFVNQDPDNFKSGFGKVFDALVEDATPPETEE